MFAENENKDTPCDCAEKQHHKDLALNLESQMVFSRDPEAEEIEAEYAALDKREVRFLFFLIQKLWTFILNFKFLLYNPLMWSSLQYAKYPFIYLAIPPLENLEVVSVL